MDERRKSGGDRRDAKDRRQAKPGKYKGVERRGQTILREKEVFEILLPPLKGARDRRSGPRRKASSD